MLHHHGKRGNCRDFLIYINDVDLVIAILIEAFTIHACA